MRVIAGTARRMNLVCPSGKDTRPTTDRIKETLFNILQEEVPGARFLDLFSGSGGIGIEALSRGSAHCVFVENGREALGCIKRNLDSTGFAGISRVMPVEVMSALRRLDGRGEVFDIIFMDPPYKRGLEERVLPFLTSSSLVRAGTLLIVEAAIDTDISYMEKLPCRVERIKEYKTNKHIFLRMREVSHEASSISGEF